MKLQSRNRNTFIIISLILPVCLFAMFVVFPSLDLFRMSFINWDGVSKNQQFVGTDNYRKMIFDSPDLWKSLSNNGLYFFIHLAFIPIELFVAVLLDSKVKGAKIFKSISFLPYIINGVAIAYAFSYFFSPYGGALNNILTSLHLEGSIHNWLSDPKIVNFTLASVSLWRFCGLHIILFLAGLQSIPRDIIEAATIDGANFIQKFRFITIPNMTLIIDFVLFANVRGALQTFEIPFVITGGGPGYASSTFTLYSLKTAFNFNNFGMASTMGVAIIVLIVIVGLIQNKLVKIARGKNA
ncbi:MAG TPA: sugar ABC transporter permease [Lachnospiraceae bacterium]|nr:sugar ABC transporter permease [Lachnospiraceae bacterium]